LVTLFCFIQLFIYVMKRILIILIGLLFAITINGQTNINRPENKPIYKDYGTWTLDVEGDKVGVRAYITKEPVYLATKKQYAQQYAPKSPTYRYELYLESKSIFRGNTTNTWLYNSRVFINGVEVTREQFPTGFTVSVDISPTLVYWYEVASENLDMAITWENAIYENRVY